MNLILWVLTVDSSRQVEQLCSLRHLDPKALLEVFFGAPQQFLAPKCVQVSQYTHYLWEAVRLKDVEKFEGLHFKAKASVHEKQSEISNLAEILHGQ